MRTVGDQEEHLDMCMAHLQVAPGDNGVLGHLGSNRLKRKTKQAAPALCV